MVDTSILISYLRHGRYRDFLHTALRDGRLLLPGPVLAELYAGATTLTDLRDIEVIRRSLGTGIVETDEEQWVLAGRCLAGYARRFGHIQPRDHLVDALVAAAAALFDALLVTEDVTGMGRWRDQLRRLKRSLLLQGPPG
jgi:predicted nucleic acid-binding protein